MATRHYNEKKFKQWQDLEGGGRRYWYDTLREDGFTVRYIKIVMQRNGRFRSFKKCIIAG